MLQTLHFQQPAMATMFEGWLVGPSIAQLRAISQSLREEIFRLELLMSCHDPCAEISRLNREASAKPTKVEPELLSILRICLQGYQDTEGYFDIGYRTAADSEKRLPERLQLNGNRNTVSFTDPDLSLDLGGFGKGHCLDVLAQQCLEFGVTNFLLSGGNSSMLASGKQANGEPWNIQLGTDASHLVSLMDEGFAYSAPIHPGQQHSDLVDPHTAQPAKNAQACAVWADRAATAEIFSTALVAMGPEAAHRFLPFLPDSIHVQLIQALPT
ncbi:MAG: FAD:protein FMN transferase [Bacteroidota bacterium]